MRLFLRMFNLITAMLTCQEHGIRVRSICGATELGGSILLGVSGDSTLGMRPYPGVKVELQPMQGYEAADGERQGVLVLSGVESTTPGYICSGVEVSLDELSCGDLEGCYNTGDIFRQDDRGWLYHVCRVDDLIVHSSGEKTNPVPIEALLVRMCGMYVESCCIIGTGRPFPVALFQLSASGAASGAAAAHCIVDAIEAANAASPAYSRISWRNAWVVLGFHAPLPRSAKGNVVRRAIEAIFAAGVEESDQRGDTTWIERNLTLDIDHPPPPSKLLPRPASTCKTMISREWPGGQLVDEPGRMIPHGTLVLQTVRELVPHNDLDADTPLLGAGVDSFTATELSSQLHSLTSVALSPTIVFEQPTARAITAHLMQLLKGLQPTAVAAVLVPSYRLSGSRSIGMQGASARCAGECKGNGAAIWLMLEAGGDAVDEVPAMRWTWGEVIGLETTKPEDAMAMHGGFLAGADSIDSNAFSISLGEASAMDPQQRLLLEVGYAALHSSRERRNSLSKADSGVFIAIEHLDWQLLQLVRTSRTALQRQSVYATTGEQGHVAAGRLAFVLDMHGPSMAINTACSSALVVLHCSASALRAAECGRALSAGAKLILLPFAVTKGIIATDGRSKTFNSNADGYGRSEAVVASTLDLDGGELCSSAVQAGGRSASLTAPNGSAQRAVIQLALSRGPLVAANVDCVQVQGLGSALADPVEVRAVAGALGGRTSATGIGSHKANAGHSEAPSGLLGVVIASHIIKLRRMAPNAQLREINPLVD